MMTEHEPTTDDTAAQPETVPNPENPGSVLAGNVPVDPLADPPIVDVPAPDPEPAPEPTAETDATDVPPAPLGPVLPPHPDDFEELSTADMLNRAQRLLERADSSDPDLDANVIYATRANAQSWYELARAKAYVRSITP